MTAISVALLISCNNSQNDDPVRDLVFETVGKSNTYALLGIKSDLGPDNDLTCNDSLSLVLPTRLYGYDLTALRDSLMKKAFGFLEPTTDATVTKWLDDCQHESGLKTRPVDIDAESADGFHRVTSSVVNMTDNLLVFCINTSTYLPGAANGLESLQYLNFNLADGKILTLETLFTPEGLKLLPEKLNAEASQMPEYADEVTIESLPDDNNFYLAPDGKIVFSYQPMSVGPHSLGNVRIAFYPSYLQELMSPYGRDFFGLNQ